MESYEAILLAQILLACGLSLWLGWRRGVKAGVERSYEALNRSADTFIAWGAWPEEES